MTRTRIWIMAAAVFAVIASAAGLALSHELSGDAEVRISARRLDDGRTEFALQQRINGEWGDRILPSSRYFPRSPRDDRWLNSSPLTIRTTPTSTDLALSEQLADTQAELKSTQAALAEAESRVGVDVDELIDDLDATKAAARQANEALETTRADLKTATDELADAKAALEPFTAPIVREIGINRYDDNRIITEVSQTSYNDGDVEVTDTYLRITEDGDHQFGDQPAQLVFSCTAGHLQFWLGPLQIEPGADASGNVQYVLEYKFSGDLGEHSPVSSFSHTSLAYEASFWEDVFPGRSGMVMDIHVAVIAAMRSADSVSVTITGADDESVTASFSMDGVFDTPVQPNIDRCGQYY